MKSGIYKITNKINNSSYIGKSVNINRRFNQHISESFRESSPVYNYPLQTNIRFYGVDNFNFEILEEVDISKVSLLADKEKEYYFKFNHDYNQMEPDNYDDLYMSNPREVVQIDMSSNEIINIFDSINKASKYLDITNSSINDCCRKKRRSSNGYFFCYLEDYNDKWEPMDLKKSIYQINTKDLSIVNKFQSPDEASNNLNIDKELIFLALNNDIYEAGNFIWVYVDEYNSWKHDLNKKDIYDKIKLIYGENTKNIYSIKYYRIISKYIDNKEIIFNPNLVDFIENKFVEDDSIIYKIDGNGKIVERLLYKNIDRSHRASINACILKKRNSYLGYYWCLEDDIDYYINKKGTMKTKSILRIDTHNLKVIEEYKSIKDAADIMHLKNTGEITECAKGKTGTITVKGFYWRYKKDYEKFGFQSYNDLNSIYKKQEKFYLKEISSIRENMKDDEIVTIDINTLEYVKSFKDRNYCSKFYNITRSQLSNLLRNRSNHTMNCYFITKSTLEIRLKKYFIEKNDDEI